MSDTEELLALVRHWLDYDQETGEFRWKKNAGRHGKIKGGKIAGRHDRKRYWRIGLKGRDMPAHRIAWMLVYGEIPAGQIDHINGVKDDNRIANLRVVTNAENQHSVFKPGSGSTTGARGVCLYKGKFRAQISVNGRLKWLGEFPTVAEAQAAYLAAKEKLHPASAVSKPHLISQEQQA